MALTPPLAILVYSDRNLTQARHIEVHDEALRSVRLAGSELERILNGLENLLLAVVHSPFVATRDESACNGYIEQLHPKVPHVKSLGVAGTDGMTWCGTGRGLSIADRSYFQDALAKPDTLFLGNYSIGRASKARVIPFGLRLAETGAVAYGSLDIAWLGEQMRTRGLPPDGSITVADRDGTIIARQPFADRFVGTKIPENFMYLVNAPQPGTETLTSQDGTVRVLGYIPVATPPVGLYVSVGLSYERSYGNIERLARIAALIAVAGAVVAFGLAWVVGDRMVIQPLDVIAATAARWRAGDSTARTGLSGHSEFGVVGANLDHMMDELQRHEEEREILNNELEHRVKNMLTQVQAIARMSFGKSSASELRIFRDRLRALSNGYSALRAARSEESVVGDVVDKVLESLGGRDSERFVIEGPDVTISEGQVLPLSMLLHELSTNAVKYGALSVPEGTVRITWQISLDDIRLEWEEIGGPHVKEPTRKGYGTRLIQAAGRQLGDVTLVYANTGLRCRVSTPRPNATKTDNEVHAAHEA